MKCGYDLLHSLRKSEISDRVILSAEKFLTGCASKNSEKEKIDDAPFETYHKKSVELDLEK